MREVERLLAYRRQLYLAMRVRAGAGLGWAEGGWQGSSGWVTGIGRLLVWKGQTKEASAAVTNRHPSPACPHVPRQEAEEAEERRQAEEEARAAAVVQAERQRLLREAAHLAPHLPKGVLQSMEELSLLGGGGPGAAGAGAHQAQAHGWRGGASGGWQQPAARELPASSQFVAAQPGQLPDGSAQQWGR